MQTILQVSIFAETICPGLGSGVTRSLDASGTEAEVDSSFNTSCPTTLAPTPVATTSAPTAVGSVSSTTASDSDGDGGASPGNPSCLYEAPSDGCNNSPSGEDPAMAVDGRTDTKVSVAESRIEHTQLTTSYSYTALERMFTHSRTFRSAFIQWRILSSGCSQYILYWGPTNTKGQAYYNRKIFHYDRAQR
jgi:hypothetical protein